MPRPSLPLRVHKPLISFVGKRTWPSTPAPSQPHPAAPPEYLKTFAVHPPNSLTERPPSFQDFWDAPARLWQPKHRELRESEIEAIQSGGASLF